MTPVVFCEIPRMKRCWLDILTKHIQTEKVTVLQSQTDFDTLIVLSTVIEKNQKKKTFCLSGRRLRFLCSSYSHSESEAYVRFSHKGQCLQKN